MIKTIAKSSDFRERLDQICNITCRFSKHAKKNAYITVILDDCKCGDYDNCCR